MFIGYLLWIIQSQRLLISIVKATWVCCEAILTHTPLVLYLESKLMKLCVWIVSHSPFWGNMKKNQLFTANIEEWNIFCDYGNLQFSWLTWFSFYQCQQKMALNSLQSFYTFLIRMKDSTYSFALVDSNCIRCTRVVEKYSCWVTSSSYVSQGNSFSGL